MKQEKLPRLACIADDDTGATDHAGMLTQKNVRTLVLIDTPPIDELRRYCAGFDAVIIATRTRSMEPNQARSKVLTAVDALRTIEPVLYQIKYSSTFDSTPKGNIGPAIEAAMETLRVKSTVVVPALPVNGRTTYMGHHFVNGRLLSESAMRAHPLNPMRESDLVKFLQQQTARKVGLADYDAVRPGPDILQKKLAELERQGVEMIVVDAVEQKDLRTIVTAVADNKLVTGSSGLAMEIPAVFEEKGHWVTKKLTFDHIHLREGSAAVMVVAGSCTPATRAQKEYAEEAGFKTILVAVDRVIRGGETQMHEVERVVEKTAQSIGAGENVLVYTSDEQSAAGRAHELGRELGLSGPQVGNAISFSLAEMTRRILECSKLNKLIIAGGETAGCICRALRLEALEVGKPIDPGVPCCFSLGRYKLALALKSGNFGARDFYVKAAGILRQYS